MSRNKETANYGELEAQLISCMKEIKYEGTKKKKEYNMSKFAQILIGNEYIKKLREKHREEEWEDFGRLYVKRVLGVYAPKNRKDLLFSINGFSEEYCKLEIEERYKKYAGEIKLSTKTVRNWEDEGIEEVVKKLFNEIQENDRRWLKVYADEVFAALDSAKSVPPEPIIEPDTDGEQDKRKFLKGLSGNIVAILVSLALILHIFLNDFVLSLPQRGESDEKNSPEIISFSVMNPDISLAPGGHESIDVDVYPDEADKSRLSTVSENPEIAWTEHLLVNAEENIQDEDEHLATIIVQTGRIPPAYVNVTVKNPEPVEHYNIGHIGTGTDIDNGGEN